MQLHHDDPAAGVHPPEAGFTGDVRIRGYFQRSGASRLSGATVAFAPGARTPWKTNPAGQVVVVTSGTGWAQGDGGEVVELRTGDVVHFAPGERHWEGATPRQAMTYVALQEGGVTFGEPVADADYRGPGGG